MLATTDFFNTHLHRQRHIRARVPTLLHTNTFFNSNVNVSKQANDNFCTIYRRPFGVIHFFFSKKRKEKETVLDQPMKREEKKKKTDDNITVQSRKTKEIQ